MLETSIHWEPPMQTFRRVCASLSLKNSWKTILMLSQVIAPNMKAEIDSKDGHRLYISQYLNYMSLWARFLSDSSCLLYTSDAADE